MYSPFKRITTIILLLSHTLMGCWNLPVAKEEIIIQPLYPQQNAAQTEHTIKIFNNEDNQQVITSQVFTARGGHQVQFTDTDCSEAIVDLNIPKPLSKRLYLKVKKQNTDLKLADLSDCTLAWQQHHIHVYLPEHDIRKRGCIYIGSHNIGLLGGMKDSSGGKDRKDSEKGACGYTADKCSHPGKPGHAPLRSSRSTSSNDSTKSQSEKNKGQTRELSPDRGPVEDGFGSIEDVFTAVGEEAREFVNDIQELFSLMAGRSDIPDYESNVEEVIRRVEEGTERLIKHMHETARQAEIEKKREEEEEKIEEEELKKLQEKIEMLIEEARANISPFKNIHVFIPEYRLSNVEEMKAYFKHMKQDIQKGTFNTQLTEKQKECMRAILSQINQELRELNEEIEVCFKQSDGKPSNKEKDFQLAKQLVGRLKNMRKKGLKFLVKKGEKVADYDPEVAREEQKRKKEEQPKTEHARNKAEEHHRTKAARNKTEEKEKEKEKETEPNSGKEKDEYKQPESLKLENATTEVEAYLKEIQSTSLVSTEQKTKGKMLIQQVEVLKKQEKATYRLAWRLFIYNDDISEEGASWLLEEARIHKAQAAQLRGLRSQLKVACKFTKEELAECRVKVKPEPKQEGYDTDSSDEEADLGRAEVAFRKGVMKGIGQALEKAPIEFLKSFGDLLQNPLITVNGLVDALKNLPELAAALAGYIETIEGTEEAKGAEIAEFITSQIINFAGPNKIKLLNQLSKGKLGVAVLKVAQKGNKFWKLTKEGASATKVHQKYGKIYKSKSDDLWWATVKGKGHGDAFKVFKETSKGLEWIKDADKYGNFITNKHKGPQGLFIAWGELKTVK